MADMGAKDDLRAMAASGAKRPSAGSALSLSYGAKPNRDSRTVHRRHSGARKALG